MRYLILVFCLVGSFVAALPKEAVAAVACKPHDDLTHILSEKYGEILIWVGTTKRGLVLNIYANPNGSTFTVLNVLPDGVSCIIEIGTSWASVDLAQLKGEET